MYPALMALIALAHPELVDLWHCEPLGQFGLN
jgi:hypothetical protein